MPETVQKSLRPAYMEAVECSIASATTAGLAGMSSVVSCDTTLRGRPGVRRVGARDMASAGDVYASLFDCQVVRKW